MVQSCRGSCHFPNKETKLNSRLPKAVVEQSLSQLNLFLGMARWKMMFKMLNLSWSDSRRFVADAYPAYIHNIFTHLSKLCHNLQPPPSITKESASNFAAPIQTAIFSQLGKSHFAFPNPWTPCISPWHSHGNVLTAFIGAAVLWHHSTNDESANPKAAAGALAWLTEFGGLVF